MDEVETRHTTVWEVYRLLYGPLPDTDYKRAQALQLRREIHRLLHQLNPSNTQA